MFTVACLKAFDLYSGWLVCLVINAITGKRIRTHTHHGHTHICAYGSGENVKVTGLFPNSLAWQRLQPPVSCIYIRYIFSHIAQANSLTAFGIRFTPKFLNVYVSLELLQSHNPPPPWPHPHTHVKRERRPSRASLALFAGSSRTNICIFNIFVTTSFSTAECRFPYRFLS